MRRLKGKVFDTSGKHIHCRIELVKDTKVLHNVSDDIQDKTSESKIAPQISYCNGFFEIIIDNKPYNIRILRGRLYEPYEYLIPAGESDVLIKAELRELVNVKALGLYSFDAHSHVSRSEWLDTGNLETASLVMKGEDFNFFFAGSPYDHDVHLQYLNRNFTDIVSYRDKFKDVLQQQKEKDFILDIGNEIVKCRYGHAFLMNYNQMPPFSKYYDEEFAPWLFTKLGPEPPYKIDYIYEALKKERGSNSVAVAAHPTSWWWHDNGEFITNIYSTLGFDILAGSIDAMVIMGYRSDQRYYQELWYEALKCGYFLPGVAENDEAFDTVPPKFVEFKTYTYTDEFSIDSLCKSVRAGKNIVSSGPILHMTVNGMLPGTVFKYRENEVFIVSLLAYKCYQAKLSLIQVIVNGEVYKEYELDHDIFETVLNVNIDSDSFIHAKCYDYAGNVCITNPVYIRNTKFINKDYHANVTIKTQKNGSEVEAQYWIDGNIDKVGFNGTARIKMKPASTLYVEHNGIIRNIKLFELEQLQQIFKNLYFGKFNSSYEYNPGEVPASCFKLREIKKILDNVILDIKF